MQSNIVLIPAFVWIFVFQMKIVGYSGPFVVAHEIKISYSIYMKEVIGTLSRIALNNIVMCIVLISVIREHGVSFLFWGECSIISFSMFSHFHCKDLSIFD